VVGRIAPVSVDQLWYVSIASVTLQSVFSLWLVRGEFDAAPACVESRA
jgi:hypothetical protein